MPQSQSKATLAERVATLRINHQALEEVRVDTPQGKHIIQNAEGKRNSLAIYAAITDNEGYITSSNARKGLDTFGEELVGESIRSPGTHPNIDLLLDIEESRTKRRSDVVRRESAKPIPAHVVTAIQELQKINNTPFYVYDATGIEETIERFNEAFSWVPKGFKNYFAVKALPNPHILNLMQRQGWGADCSSRPEIELAMGTTSGMGRGELIFTSNNTPESEFRAAYMAGALLNLDDITHIERVQEALQGQFPKKICFRYNPGHLRSGNPIIGEPVEAKYGLTTDQIPEAYKQAQKLGADHFGLHTMVVSNTLEEEALIENGRMVFELGARLSRDLGITFDFFNLGGGVGTPYKPEQIPVDIQKVSAGIQEAYKQAGFGKGYNPQVVMECGRAITGPHGFLATEVLHVTSKYKEFVGVDATMANLMRPGMYGAYHHITVLGKEDAPKTQIYDVTGSLCENNDKFAVNRVLPFIQRGDTLVVHNGGAHGHAMGFNYNGKLRCAEFMVRANGTITKIRRAETMEDHFRTLHF